MTKIRKNSTGLAILAVCIAMTSGCERMERSSSSNNPIHVSVNTAHHTKSAAVTKTSLESAGKFVLDVIADESYGEFDSDGNLVGSMHAAGPYITSGGKANVLYSSAENSYTPTTRDDADKTEGWYIYDTDYEVYNWINGAKLRFWARYPQDSDLKGSLSLTVPGVNKSTEDFTYNLPTHVAGSDATNQDDILFAYAERTKQKKDTNDDIDITFYHPLSEICFCVSPDDETFDVNLQIKRIEITNVPKGGSCTFDPSGTIAGKTMFTWTPSTTLESYSQDYNASFDTAPAGWDGTEYDTVNHWHVYTCQNAFMMIPTELSHASGKETTLKITFYDTATSSDVVREINICGSGTTDDPYITWHPGHFYIYKIVATKIGRSIDVYVVLTDWTDRESKINISC